MTLKQINKYISDRGLKHAWIADRLDISPSYLSLILTGQRGIPGWFEPKLKTILGKINKVKSNKLHKDESTIIMNNSKTRAMNIRGINAVFYNNFKSAIYSKGYKNVKEVIIEFMQDTIKECHNVEFNNQEIAHETQTDIFQEDIDEGTESQSKEAQLEDIYKMIPEIENFIKKIKQLNDKEE